MTPEDFLDVLRKHLTVFSPENQATLIEEIGSHIECGENDEGLGSEEVERIQKLFSELGSPEELGRGFRSVHRSGRLIDFLLVAIPTALFTILQELNGVTGFVDRSIADYIQFFISLTLIFIGLRRRSFLLTMYWVPYVVLIRIAGLIRGQGWLDQPGFEYSSIETIIWATVLASLLFVFSRLIWRNRHDIFNMLYAFHPILQACVGYSVWLYRLQSGWIAHNTRLVYTLGMSYNSIVQSLIDLTEVTSIIAWGLIFLSSNRDIRWLALAGYVSLIGFGRVFMAMGSGFPVWVYVLWSIPTIILVLGWSFDRFRRKSFKLILD